MHHIRSRALFLVAAIALLAGCAFGGPPPATPAPSPTPIPPTPTPTPAQLSALIGKATQASPSVHFEIALSGVPVFADDTRLFAINTIAGDLKRPDGVLETLKIGNAGATSELKMVSLAGKQYITNPITRAWQCLPAGAGFDPAVLFDPKQGIEYLLQNAYQNVTLVGTEDVAGVPSYHLRGTVAGPPLLAISSGLLGVGTTKVDLWADTSTMRATQIVLVDSATDQASPTTWTLKFGEYEKAVDVREPPGVKC